MLISPAESPLAWPARLAAAVLSLTLLSCGDRGSEFVHVPDGEGGGKTAADYEQEDDPVKALLARARGSVNATALKQWALALRVYAESEGGDYPETLEELVGSKFLPPPEGPTDAEKAVAEARNRTGSQREVDAVGKPVAPRTTAEMGRFLNSRETPYPPKWSDPQTGEATLPLYITGLTSESPADTIVLAGNRPNPDGTRDVAYQDCRTATIPEAEFQAKTAGSAAQTPSI